ncbi:DUF1540 domain-containing protein [Clostridiaceae bacterium 14S0207]|nr:DUF1540 domain-containing protein [Clostridiaceae bacterium 14S0207]
MEHNESIKCTVTECKHHCNKDNYCTLDCIEVVKHDAHAKDCQCTDCASFIQK